MKLSPLSTVRQEIDKTDGEILVLLSQRADLAIKIKDLKAGNSVYKPDREAAITERLKHQNQSALSDEAIGSIYTEIISACRNLQKTLSVAYLGPEGTYSHEAAMKMFGTTTDYSSQITLHETIKVAENGNTDIAFLPIENSSEGAVIETHRLLLATDLEISGEYILPVKHCLLSTAKKLTDIRSIHAHPQALGQCREWLQLHVPSANLVAESSNGQAVANVKNKPSAAAIASQQAAAIAKLPILITGINDFAGNKTRFIALSHITPDVTVHDKTSVICSTRDKIGALNELLSILTSYKINLLRLESQPHADHDYVFYIDFEGHQNNTNVSKALVKLAAAAKTCKILGSYPRG